MSRKHVLGLLGAVLIIVGIGEGGWSLLLIWLGTDFLILAIAHSWGAHRVFGKRSDGTLPLCSKLIFLPLLTYTTLVWHLIRIFSREAAHNVVIADRLVIGRRLLPSEVGDRFDNYVDLTAEFEEPRPLRILPGYCCFPILDGAAPVPEALHKAVCSLTPGKTFIHGAQGHGRTGLFALAVLFKSGIIQSLDEGLAMVQVARPGVQLSNEQYECIQKCAEL